MRSRGETSGTNFVTPVILCSLQLIISCTLYITELYFKPYSIILKKIISFSTRLIVDTFFVENLNLN